MPNLKKRPRVKRLEKAKPVKGWSYSPYRAMLRFNGKNFAIVTPDGRNALSEGDAEILVDNLNSGSRLKAAVEWALGMRGSFKPREEGQPPYWWRTELRCRCLNHVED